MSNETLLHTEKDFETAQEVRWCPGCGDYAILKQVKRTLAETGIPKEDIVFISGIGCSSRFPYYVDTYGVHSIHGRALSMATGLKTTRPELSVWVVTGDGDGLSIGGNHFLHTMRRNPDINVLMFNNRIYGLTKGQYSPTSEQYKITKSSPDGSLGVPLTPALVALSASASFVARSVDTESKHLQDVLQRAEQHKGTSFVEIYQNCNIFNDGAFDQHKDKATKDDSNLFLVQGQPLLFGKNQQWGIRLDGLQPRVVAMDTYNVEDLWIHDDKDYHKSLLLSNFGNLPSEGMDFPIPMGVIYAQERETFETQVQEQHATTSRGNINHLIQGKQSWIVE